MVVCNFCNRRETRTRRFTLPFTCIECEKIPEYYTDINNEITYVDASGKNVNIKNDTEIEIEIETDSRENFIDTNNYKDSLLASLYSQVEFLRNEINEKNLLIRVLTTRERELNLNSTHDQGHLKDQVKETVVESSKSSVSLVAENAVESQIAKDDNFVEANDESFVPVFNSTVEINDNTRISNETENELMLHTLNNSNGESENYFNESFHDLVLEQIELKKSSISEQLKNIISYLTDNKPTTKNGISTVNNSIEKEQSNTVDGSVSSSLNSGENQYRFEWEKHSSGFAGRIIDKMGYKGKGLGKNEDGIVEAIKIDDSNKFYDLNTETNAKKKMLYILSSSMLNQMDEQRLSRENIIVKTKCHGGCTVKCMYTHLPTVFSEKPDFILLHIGSK